MASGWVVVCCGQRKEFPSLPRRSVGGRAASAAASSASARASASESCRVGSESLASTSAAPSRIHLPRDGLGSAGAIGARRAAARDAGSARDTGLLSLFAACAAFCRVVRPSVGSCGRSTCLKSWPPIHGRTSETFSRPGCVLVTLIIFVTLLAPPLVKRSAVSASVASVLTLKPSLPASVCAGWLSTSASGASIAYQTPLTRPNSSGSERMHMRSFGERAGTAPAGPGCSSDVAGSPDDGPAASVEGSDIFLSRMSKCREQNSSSWARHEA